MVEPFLELIPDLLDGPRGRNGTGMKEDENPCRQAVDAGIPSPPLATGFDYREPGGKTGSHDLGQEGVPGSGIDSTEIEFSPNPVARGCGSIGIRFPCRRARNRRAPGQEQRGKQKESRSRAAGEPRQAKILSRLAKRNR